ncbi:MAG: sugar-transfer associated ATP-grasp domain-containing protein [Candidatus Sphingomonas phytovorans]|nr:sugar-transfer associated ATP-grasp domain-containing protein [Sphingomonas sp.]WEK01338.1 MAG: sugar-transfer associated ATP-grasp domain-containing protein [Sphingomonas sp.]
MRPFRRVATALSAFSQYGFPFLPGPAPTPTARLRRLTGPSYLPKRRRFLRPLVFVTMILAWPVGALATAIRVQRRDTPPGQLRRIVDAWWLAVTRNVPPFEYRAYCLDQPGSRADLLQFVFWTDLRAFAELNARRGAVEQAVKDKARFASICETHGLASVPTLAVFRDGIQVTPTAPFVPEAPELWVKSLAGHGGQGAALWRRADGSYRNGEDAAIAADKFAQHVSGADCIVQPRVLNHPAIADMTNGALASLRIITGVDRERRATVVGAMLYLPSGDRITSVAGIGCAIEMDQGALTRALDFRNGAPDITRHPDTNAQITGRTLPFWPESLALAIRAHETGFGRFAFLGWDITLTAEGPLLLEANSGWLALHLQLLNGPLGRTEFSRILNEHL